MSRVFLSWFAFVISLICAVTGIEEVGKHNWQWAAIDFVMFMINGMNAMRIVLTEEIKQAIRESKKASL